MSDRMSLSRILAPTDFSDCATAAVEYAKVLARRFGAGIMLLHAVPPRATFEPLPLTGVSHAEQRSVGADTDDHADRSVIPVRCGRFHRDGDGYLAFARPPDLNRAVIRQYRIVHGNRVVCEIVVIAASGDQFVQP